MKQKGREEIFIEYTPITFCIFLFPCMQLCPPISFDMPGFFSLFHLVFFFNYIHFVLNLFKYQRHINCIPFKKCMIVQICKCKLSLGLLLSDVFHTNFWSVLCIPNFSMHYYVFPNKIEGSLMQIWSVSREFNTRS